MSFKPSAWFVTCPNDKISRDNGRTVRESPLFP